MSTTLDFSALNTVFPQAQSIVCFLHPQTTYDAVAAALAFSLAAQEQGKKVSVVCEEPMRVEYNALVGIDQVTGEVGNKDLVLSFAYNENQVDKVSYNVNEIDQRFELVISPKNGHTPLDPSTIEFFRTGLSADIVILFGYHAFNELGDVYEKQRQTFDSAYTVAITQGKIPAFAKLHLQLQQDQLSYSELFYFLIRQLKIAEIHNDIASNLAAGIEYASDRFTGAVLPRTFETFAHLMRSGAQRQPNNPAFEHLATPIRNIGQMAPYQGAQPVFSGGALPSAQNMVVPNGGQASAAVSPSEFAKAMSAGRT